MQLEIAEVWTTTIFQNKITLCVSNSNRLYIFRGETSVLDKFLCPERIERAVVGSICWQLLTQEKTSCVLKSGLLWQQWSNKVAWPAASVKTPNFSLLNDKYCISIMKVGGILSDYSWHGLLSGWGLAPPPCGRAKKSVRMPAWGSLGGKQVNSIHFEGKRQGKRLREDGAAFSWQTALCVLFPTLAEFFFFLFFPNNTCHAVTVKSN